MSVEITKLHLRDLGVSLRIAASCLVLLLGGGYAASLYHMMVHVGEKDDEPGLTLIDVIGTYHGVDKPAPLLVALDDAKHRENYATDLSSAEEEILRRWLAADVVSGGHNPIQTGYDALPPGAPDDALAPADVLDERCTRCHASNAIEGGGIGQTIALSRWPEVEDFVYSKKLEPITVEILAMSTHTHALSIPLFTLLAGALLLATRWPRAFRHGTVMLCFVGLLADFSGMWLARSSEPLVWLIIGGGALYGATFTLALVAALLDLWLPRPR